LALRVYCDHFPDKTYLRKEVGSDLNFNVLPIQAVNGNVILAENDAATLSNGATLAALPGASGANRAYFILVTHRTQNFRGYFKIIIRDAGSVIQENHWFTIGPGNNTILWLYSDQTLQQLEVLNMMNVALGVYIAVYDGLINDPIRYSKEFN